MKLLSINIRGLRKQWKRKWVREIVGKEKVDFLAIHETKISDISSQLVRLLWDFDDFEFVVVNACGKAGGLLWVWSKSSFVLQHTVSGVGYALIQGEVLSTKGIVVLVNVYGPQAEGEKKVSWNTLLDSKDMF